MQIQKKIKLIREQMKLSKIDAYIIPSSDPHASEYLPEFYKTRQWASGFTGSAGTLVLTLKEAALWTDGRYHIQAEKELANTEITLVKDGLPGQPSISEWIIEKVGDKFNLGFNGMQMMTSEVEKLMSAFEYKTVSYDFTSNLVDKIWLDRPLLPVEKVFMHPDKYIGDTTENKLKRIRESIDAIGASSHLITKLDDIAWITNLRGNDIENNPYFLSYLFITMDYAYLYVDPLKLNEEIIQKIHMGGIKVKHYDDLVKDLAALSCKKAILLDKSATPYYISKSLSSRCKVINHSNPSTLFKAQKNDVELSHIRQCHIEDGLSVVRFMIDLEKKIGNVSMTEFNIDEMITQRRAENPLYIERSFSTIAAYRDHGAIMHYKASPENAYTLEPKGFLLVDSGGQYLNGTTDITRTIALGDLTEQEKKDYTLTLKSMMALSSATFLAGTTGTQLDTFARMHMWSSCMDYKSGTGHGIGYMLGVHEGPHRVSTNLSPVALTPGMILSNEPGVYRAGAYGIRLENILAVKQHAENEFGSFYKFETLTMCPFDIRAIDESMLTDQEKEQLNSYHKTVYDTLSPYLNEEEKAWLKDATASI